MRSPICLPPRKGRAATWLERRVEERLTERAATFEPGEFRAVLFEQAVGELSPDEALGVLAEDGR